jgi:hypothetical protein
MHSLHKLPSIAARALLGSVLAFAAARSVLAGGPEGTQTARGGVAGEDLYMAGPVRVETPDGVQEGAGLRHFIAEERLEFERPVFYQ